MARNTRCEQKGGRDNVTIVLCEVQKQDSGRRLKMASALKAAIRVVPRGMFFPAPVFRGRGVFVFGG